LKVNYDAKTCVVHPEGPGSASRSKGLRMPTQSGIASALRSRAAPASAGWMWEFQSQFQRYGFSCHPMNPGNRRVPQWPSGYGSSLSICRNNATTAAKPVRVPANSLTAVRPNISPDPAATRIMGISECEKNEYRPAAITANPTVAAIRLKRHAGRLA